MFRAIWISKRRGYWVQYNGRLLGFVRCAQGFPFRGDVQVV